MIAQKQTADFGRLAVLAKLANLKQSWIEVAELPRCMERTIVLLTIKSEVRAGLNALCQSGLKHHQALEALARL